MLVAIAGGGLVAAGATLDTLALPDAAPAAPAAPATPPPLPRPVSVVGAAGGGLPPWTGVVIPLVAGGRLEIRVPTALDAVIGIAVCDRPPGTILGVVRPAILAAPLGAAVLRDTLAVSPSAPASAPTPPAPPRTGTLLGIAPLVAAGRSGTLVAALGGGRRPVGGRERFPFAGRFPRRPALFVAAAATVDGRNRLPGRRCLVAARNAQFRGE